MNQKRTKSDLQQQNTRQDVGRSTDAAARQHTTALRVCNSRWAVPTAAAILVLATVAAYHNSLHGPFVLDDAGSTVENASIHHLWPIWKTLCPPNHGETVTGRPLLNFSFAVNYAISGAEVWSYHAVNLLFHVLAALLLFGVVRRTLLLGTGPSAEGDRSMFSADVLPAGGVFPPKNGPVPAVGPVAAASLAVPLAFVIALLWAVHPLLTESVTYTVQRAESLVGLFYLLTLYCVIRGATRAGAAAPSGSTQLNGRVPRVACPPVFSALLDKPGTDRRLVVAPNAEDKAASLALSPHPNPLPVGEGTRGFTEGEGTAWYIAAALACLAGMASKEVMVSAPLIVLLFDRAFLAGSFREAWRQRKGLYIALALTWLLLGGLIYASGHRGRSVGFDVEVGWWTYLCTQFGAIVHYLRLSIWPHPLIFDYGVYTARGFAAIVPYAIMVALLAAATIYAMWRWPKIGFLGAWFFAILAPTSSVVPVATQTIAEHRMYLPLIAVVGGVVFVIFYASQRLIERGSLSPRAAGVVGSSLVVVVGLAFVVVTIRRNMDYASEKSIWEDTIQKAPYNPRAYCNLGSVFANKLDDEDTAIRYLQDALRLKPDYADANHALGTILFNRGSWNEAVGYFQKAVDAKPRVLKLRYHLANALVCAQQPAKALEHYEIVLPSLSEDAEAHLNYANALSALGPSRLRDALAEFGKALELKSDYAEAYYKLAYTLDKNNRLNDAVANYRKALKIDPNYASAHFDLANALVRQENFKEAVGRYRKAIELNPELVDAYRNLAYVLVTCPDPALRNVNEAAALAKRAIPLATQQKRPDIIQFFKQDFPSLRGGPQGSGK